MTAEAFIKQYGLRLDPQQKKAVQTTEGPVLLLAVPGSGKTTTLVSRLGYLVLGLKIQPENILTMTYTVAATGEMRQRFGKMFGEELARRLDCRTINSLCCKIIAAYERQGHRAPALIEEGKRNALLKEIWSETEKVFPTEQDIKGAGLVIGNVKNRMVKEDEEIQEIGEKLAGDSQADWARIYREYQRAMRQAGLMDYDDQMVFALAILHREPEILHGFQNRYQYICVDEAQDTSHIQHEILTLLAQKNRNIFLVGDEDQSIYGFRAAEPEKILDFEKRWPGAQVLFIETNYRSTQEITQGAMRVIRQNRKRRDKTIRPVCGHGPQIETILCETRGKQYDRLVQIAEEAAKTGRETAILYRNNETALPVIDALVRKGIPYRAKGVDSLFFQSREYLDMLAFFRVARNPGDAEAFLRIFYTIDGLYAKKQEILEAAQEETDVFRFLKNTDRRKEVRRIFTSLPGLSAKEAIRRIREDLGYEDWLSQRKMDPFRLSILEMLARNHKSLEEFFLHMEDADGLRAAVARGSDSQAGCILSTIHSAKGLEFDRVILADVVDGIFPSANAISQEAKNRVDDMEEERRLFYVGVTRARKELAVITFKEEMSTFSDVLTGKECLKKTVEPEKNEWELFSTRNHNRAGARMMQDTALSSIRDIDRAYWQKQINSHEIKLIPGTAVRHKTLGQGKIQNYSKGVLTIQLEKGEEKKLDACYVLAKGILEVIS